MDSNFSVASAFSIWEADTYEGHCGRELVGAALAIYGSRTTIILYNTHNCKVEQMTLLKLGKRERWLVTNPELKIQPEAKLFACAVRTTPDFPN